MDRDEQVTFLIVDDDEISVLSIRRALVRLGVAHPVEVAHDGEEALRRLRDRSEAPVVVLLDLNMPRMGGLEFLDTLARDGMPAATTVLLLVGLDTPEAIDAHQERIAGRVFKDDLPGSLRHALAELGLLSPEIDPH